MLQCDAISPEREERREKREKSWDDSMNRHAGGKPSLLTRSYSVQLYQPSFIHGLLVRALENPGKQNTRVRDNLWMSS